MDYQEHEYGQTSNKLRLIRSPLVGEDKPGSDSSSAYHRAGRADVESLGFRDGPNHDCPEFQRREEATNIELFFDLFFAANLTVFSEIHVVTDREKLVSYIGYFCMLWFTWALVGLFDVRFVTDSIFERIARAGHLGVMIGFAVVAPNFDPNHQNKQTFRTMSLILMVSRLLMVVQYGTIIWHVRKYRNTKLPLSLMVAIHFIAAMIYLGITFRFRDYNSRVYIAWYIIAVVETALNVAGSLVWDVLSFKGTHFTSRMSLLTLIIIGEGIIVVCSNVTTIVKNPNSWTPATIGSITAGIATIYIVYQIYFDWQRHIHLPPIRQLCWAFLHFPFHLALTLFVHGSSQFITWWKILEVIFSFQDKVVNAFSADIPDGASYRTWFLDTLNNTVQDVFELYPPVYVNTYIDVDDSFEVLKGFNESFYRQEELVPGNDTAVFNKSLSNIIRTVENSLFTSFNIDSVAETVYDGDSTEFETEVNRENWNRFYLVFIYTFVTAGLVLMLMNVLFIISRMKRWSPFNIFRAILNFLVGLGLALVALIQLNDDDASQFQSTPWILPTLCLTFFVILVINHLPKPPPLFFKRKNRSSKPERTVLLGGPQYGPPQGPPKLQDQHLPTTTEYHKSQHMPTNPEYYNGQHMPQSTGHHNGQQNGQYTTVPL